MYDVSIIIPVYNSVKYLEIALKSILDQDYESFEIILVDDGSTDGSEIVCDQFSNKYSNISVLHKKNGGMCSARNAGMRIAKGKYIMFCDNDDIYLPNILKDNLSLAKKYDADIVKFSRLRIHVDDENITEESYIYKYNFSIFKDEEVIKNYRIARNISSGVWCNVYKKSIIDNYSIQFPEDFRFGYEDMFFNIKYYQYVKKMILNPKVYYHWIQRDTHSTTKKFSENFLYALEKCLEEEYQFILDKNIQNICPGSWEDILTNYYVIGYYLALLNPKSPYTKKEKLKKCKEYREKKCFNQLNKMSLTNLKKIDYKRYLILKLFLKNQHLLNFLIIDFYSKHISKIV